MRIKESTNLLSGILFTLVFGSISHFFYEWSGEHPIVGMFFPINESLWEHMKLLFFPVLLYTFYEMFAFMKIDCHFLTARLLGLLTGLFVIPCFFFIYLGFFGQTIFLFDLGIYIISILVTFLVSRYLDLYADLLYLPFFVLFVILLFLLILFFSFTFSPPDLPLFWEIHGILAEK